MTTYKWNELGINEVTSLYLYGQTIKPADLLSDAIIRSPWVKTNSYQIELDAVSFMATGAGRFANASQINLVRLFMNGEFAFKNNGLRQEFSLGQAVAIAGAKMENLSIAQSSYQDGKDDLLMRAYIYQSSSYTIAQDARFIVEADGTRRIENFAVIPFHDDFDFQSDSLLSKVANGLLEPKIDPSGIGRKVDFIFDDSTKNAVPRTSYAKASFEADKLRYEDTYRPAEGMVTVALAVTSGEYSDALWSAGVTQFLDDAGRFIIYGTNDADALSAATVDFTLIRGELRVAMDKKGVVLVGGGGYDTLIGTAMGDVLFGGAGNDTLTGQDGNDRLEGGGGLDILEGGEGRDTLAGGTGFDQYTADDGDTISDVDGQGRVGFEGYTLTGGEKLSGKDVLTSLGAAQQWRGAGGEIYVRLGSNLFVLNVNTKALLIQNYNITRKDLGIDLKDDNEEDDDSGGGGGGDGDWWIGLPGEDIDDIIKRWDGVPNIGSPLILDLDGGGVDTTALTRGSWGGVHFNLDAKGLNEQTGWVGRNDGLLVRDLDGDGAITSGRELFGNATLLKNGWLTASNGFEALKELDTAGDRYGDGVVDIQDAAWAVDDHPKLTHAEGV